MPKIHTRRKRQLNLTPNRPFSGVRRRAQRPKTFPTAERAHAWAADHGVTVKELLPAKRGKRLRIVS